MTGQPSTGVLVAIPCFDEERNIGRTLADVFAHAGAVDVVVVDDGSDDRTAAVVRDARHARVTVIRHPLNLGYGSAIQTAAKYAQRKGYRTLVFFDGDGQHSALDVPAALALVADGRADVGVGSRFLGTCGYHVPFSRRAGMATFRVLLRLLSGLRVTDPTSGLQVLNSRAIRICGSESFSTAFPDADMLLLYHRAGLKVVEFPASFRARTHGKSMHSVLASAYYIYKMTVSMLVVAITPGTKAERS